MYITGSTTLQIVLNLHWCGCICSYLCFFRSFILPPSVKTGYLPCFSVTQLKVSNAATPCVCEIFYVWSIFGGSSNSWWNLWPVQSIISVSLNAAVFGFWNTSTMPQMDAFIPSTHRPTQTGLLAFCALIWLLKFFFPTHILLVLLFLCSIAKLTWTFYFTFEKKNSHKWSAVTLITLTAVLKQEQEH